MKSRSLIAVARQLGLAGPEYIRKTLPRRARRERLLLAVMRHPPGEPDDLERSPDATVRIGETLGVDFRHPLQCGAPERAPAALHERIGHTHAEQIVPQLERRAVACGDPVDVGYRQREARPLKPRPHCAHLREGWIAP